MLYALSVGAGTVDPNGFELEFTTENSEGRPHRALPTFAVIAAFKTFGGGTALAGVGTYEKAMIVHGEEAITWHRPVPPEGHVKSSATITGIYDKGSGAVVASESVTCDAATGEPMFTINTSVFIRGEGGFGGDRGPSGRTEPPNRDPDHRITYHTRPDQALLYRLTGDRNPLHADPAFARRGGFERPIMHGLCTYGFTGRALLHTVCESDPSRMQMMVGRFSRPVYPGETLTIAIWRLGSGEVAFRTFNPRGEVVIDGGRCLYTDSA